MLWSGDHLFPGTKETLEMLRSKGEDVKSRKGMPWGSSAHIDIRQATRFCDQQQHKIARGLQEEV